MIETRACVTGRMLSREQFIIHETDKAIDVSSVFDVLRGDLAGCRIRNFMSPEVCQCIVENFWKSSALTPRYGEGEDGVEGYFVGASHIEKTTLDYLQDAERSEKAVENLFLGTENPAAIFRHALSSYQGKNRLFRAAEYNGLKAGNLKAVFWNSMGKYLLQPHDDFAQLSDPRQKGFEIQNASRVMAVNMYVEVPANAGQLKLWNIEPDNRSRAELGLTYSGFPYPPEVLEDFQSTVIPVAAGDLCVINGNLAHAVLRGEPTISSKNRLLLTFFMTFNANNELLWWT